MNSTYSDPGVVKKSAQAAVASGTNNQGSLNHAGQPGAKPLNINLSELLITPRVLPTILDLKGANINLQVNSVVVKTHEHHISKFAYLVRLIKKARLVNPQGDTLTIAVTGDDELVSDFLNTFKILGASSIDEHSSFDTKTLVSAARISARYNYPALRAFCIKQLEGFTLNSMERLQIARALDLKSWEGRAYQELSEREAKITKEEALDLGMDAYWQIANAREMQQQRNAINHSVENNNPPERKLTQTLPQAELASGEKSNGVSLYIYFLLMVSVWMNFVLMVESSKV
ncbi:hypothetical protein RSAG8_02207, partial [Rhizoctonia solani AG-8 WAC10335]